MLKVKSIAEVNDIIDNHFARIRMGSEFVSLEISFNRSLAEDIIAQEFVPDFNRSTVDGYAVKASDVFGCSDSIPALLSLVGESLMGQHITLQLKAGQCVYVHTGSEVPAGADSVVMLEDAEDYKNGTVAINKPCAPGSNIIYRGDDVKPGECIMPAGKRIRVADIGTFAAMGISDIPVIKQPHVAILSTGDELVNADSQLSLGQIRDVNGPLISEAVKDCGGIPEFLGIFKDDENVILSEIAAAIKNCDVLIITGGTSVGVKDSIPSAITNLGEIFVHGVAAKPGKPTIVGAIDDKPVFGIPGNPMAAYFMFRLFVRPLLYSMLGSKIQDRKVMATMSQAVSTNHGREEFMPVLLDKEYAQPIVGKSGIISILSRANGFTRIPRDCEGLKQGEIVEVTLFENI